MKRYSFLIAALTTAAVALASTGVAAASSPTPASPPGPGEARAHPYFDDSTGPPRAGVVRGAPAGPLLRPKHPLGSRTAVAPGAAAPSAALSPAAAAPPDPEVLGFAQSGEIGGGGWRSDLHFDLLSTIAYFGIDVNGDGSLSTGDYGYQTWWSSQTTDLINTAHGAGDRVVLTVKSFGSQTIQSIVGNESYRQAAIRNIIGELTNRGGDGVNVDFEGSSPTVSAGDFTTFMAELEYALRTRLPQSSYLTVDTYGSSAGGGGMFDIPGLRPYVDAFDVMAYDITAPGSSHAGPVAPLDNYPYSDVQILNQYLSVVPASQVILGVPYYGYKWSVTCNPIPNCPMAPVGGDGAASAGTYSGLLDDFSCAVNLTGFYDSSVNEPWATWWSPPSGDPCGGNHGSWREAYYENARSLGAKYDLVNTHALRGIGIWALGYDSGHADLWNVISAKFSVTHGPGGGGPPPVRPTLARYYNPAVGHWVTASAPTSSFSSGPGFQESEIGSLSRQWVPGLQNLYSCASGESVHFLSLYVGCEGQTQLGLDGYAAQQSGGGYTVPIWRCRVPVTNDHFVSSNPGCEGQVAEALLGYAAREVPFLRYYAPWTGDHWMTSGVTSTQYRLEATLAWMVSTPTAAAHPLYECLAGGKDRFTSTSANCEGQQRLTTIGSAMDQPVAGTVPLYRCWVAAVFDHFDSTDPSCEQAGQLEATLGYLFTQP